MSWLDQPTDDTTTPALAGAPTQRLIFVYNADASPMGLLRDLYSGLTTGQTECNLCDITFGKLLKDRSWKRFVDDLPYEVDFQLRSTFRKGHPFVEAGFPALFFQDPDGIRLVLGKDRIDAVDDLDELKTLVSAAVDELRAQKPPVDDDPVSTQAPG